MVYQLTKLAGDHPPTKIMASTKQMKRYIRSPNTVYSSNVQTPPFVSPTVSLPTPSNSSNMDTQDPQSSGSSVDGPSEMPQRLDPKDYPGTHYMGGKWRERVSSSGFLGKLEDDFFLPPEYQFVGEFDLSVKTTPPNCLAVYKHTLMARLRFPLPPLIVKILNDYNNGLPQLTPNSWPSIFSFIATCNKNKSEGWCCLYNRNGFLTAINRPTSIHNWKYEFIFVEKDPDSGPWEVIN